jgi:molybdate transport system substrate-binding protein
MSPKNARPKEPMTPPIHRWRPWLTVALWAASAWAQAQDLKVIAPNAVRDALTAIAARFETESGRRVQLSWGGSEAIARRVADGEVFDVVVNAAPSVDRLITDGRLVGASRIGFARSGVAAAVRAGLPAPDISSVAALKATLLEAQSIAISSGASGRYLEQLFQTLGVSEQIRGKLRQPPSGAQIGEMLARGEADLGFQQVTELKHAHGIVFLGLLPAEVQNFTQWTAGVHVEAAKDPGAQAFSRALAAPASGPAIRESGMEAI